MKIGITRDEARDISLSPDHKLKSLNEVKQLIKREALLGKRSTSFKLSVNGEKEIDAIMDALAKANFAVSSSYPPSATTATFSIEW